MEVAKLMVAFAEVAMMLMVVFAELALMLYAVLGEVGLMRADLKLDDLVLSV